MHDDPWQVREADFPQPPTSRAVWMYLLNYAVLAPSIRNTQPWKFRLDGDQLEMLADTRRALPVADPHRRELVISCGAALYNLRVALRHFRYSPVVELLPDPAQPGLLARVTLGPRESPPPIADDRVFKAITRRRTHRGEFFAQTVFAASVEAMREAAETEGAWWFAVTTAEQLNAIAGLVAEADLLLMGNADYRRELADWLRPNYGGAHDGMPGYALGLGNLVAAIAPVLVRLSDIGKRWSQRDARLIRSGPVVAVIGTMADTIVDWLVTGQALQAALLQARVHGLSAAYHNQAIEVAPFRQRLAQILRRPGLPQLLLRFGYAPEGRPTPRRPVRDVLE
ncbi:MAG: nitroreductase [Verrucomicrobiae bacterium]|nr:nitroreductase [Verrucomicrobiae bacterium]